MKKNYGKLAIVFLPIIVAIIVLWPTYKASQLEKLENDALNKAKHATTKADSLNIMQNFYNVHGEDLDKAKNNRLKLGLDLRGGMYVTLEVDIIKLLEEAAVRETVDETFGEVIEKTKADLKNSKESTLKLFFANFDAIAKPKGKSLISYFDIGNLKDASEDKIKKDLEAKATDAIAQAQQVIRQRIDKYGVSEPNIQVQGGNRIILELPGVKDPTEMRKLIVTTARLEFKLVRNSQDIIKSFYKIDEYLVNKRKGFNPSAIDTSAKLASKSDTSKTGDTTKKAKKSKDPYEGMKPEQAQKQYALDHPFTHLFNTFFVTEKNVQNFFYIGDKDSIPIGQYMFRIAKDSIDKFQEMLERNEIKIMIPYDLQLVVGAKPESRGNKDENKLKKNQVFEIQCVKREAELLGDCITDARKNVDPTNNSWVVNMQMNSEGAEKWAKITGANIGKRIAIVLDGQVYSAPNVINKISGGNSQIMGMANSAEANTLEITLKAGALKAPVKIIEERVIGASLGDDSIKSGITASLIAVLLVILFMLVYYSKGGGVADIAMMINLLLNLTVLAALQGTLSLPGIAGIILTLGIAVDANILIFERIREEIYHGRNIKAAIDQGFDKALSAIIDTHVTTFITGMILYFLGSGFIQGFALTLMVGIITTLFTGVVVSKAILHLTLGDNATTYNFGQPVNE